MRDRVRACVPRIVEPHRLEAVAERSIAENPANAPILPRGLRHEATGALEMAVMTGDLWRPGRRLRVAFLEGDSVVHRKVERVAGEWTRHANVGLEFGTARDAEIRIAFQDAGSWSYVGTVALDIARDEPTMNFGWLFPDSPDEDYQDVVLHEFGHALGAIHEHQSPEANIPWDREAVYEYYGGPPNNWSREQVDRNIFERYSHSMVRASQFDRESIMLYPIPDEHTTVPGWEVGWNRRLSDGDKQFIAKQYPREAPGSRVVELDGTPVAASIGQPGDMDWFTFELARPGEYEVETHGRTDVFMTLLGPDSDSRWVAADDDSGQQRNAKIVTRLDPGAYRVAVRHYRHSGSGEYEITLRSR